MSRERHKLAEAEAVDSAEGNMCGASMRGTDALPWSKTSSRPKGMRRNLGGLIWPVSPWRRRAATGTLGARRWGTGEESDALHSTDEALEQSRDGPGMQGVGGGGGRGGKGARSKGRQAATHAPDTAPGSACHRRGEPTDRRDGSLLSRTSITFDPRQEPGAGKPQAGICAGGGEQSPSLPRPVIATPLL